MKYLYILLLGGSVSVTFAQKGEITYNHNATDGTNNVKIKILDNEDDIVRKSPALFINGKAYPKSLLQSIDETQIKSFRIEEGDTTINRVKYHGRIYVTTKERYHIIPVTLSFVKEKYTNLNDQFIIFLVNGKIITEDPDNYFIDDNFILQVSIGSLKKPEMKFVEIITKTGENKKKMESF
jgi:hypothetical protein